MDLKLLINDLQDVLNKLEDGDISESHGKLQHIVDELNNNNQIEREVIHENKKDKKLWLLRPVGNLSKDENPWEPWYDKAFGFVVRAKNEKEAREFAHKNAGDENYGKFLSQKTLETIDPWKNQKYSVCIELTKSGDPGVIIQDFAGA